MCRVGWQRPIAILRFFCRPTSEATFEALRATYGYLTPDLWKPTHFAKSPFQEFTDYLAQSKPGPAY